MSRTILVTGSSSGLGKAVANHFAGRDGWNVAATMRDPARGGMFSGIPDTGVFELDVTKSETIRSAVDEAVAAFGTIDVLFNNVGYGGLMLFEETTDESFRKAFETNFFGHLEVMRAVLPVMRTQRSGFVINVTSLAGLFGIPLQTAYCASKFAMTGFTESVKWELASAGIDVTVFEVGGMKTDFAAHMSNGRELEVGDYDAYMARMVPAIAKATERFEASATDPADVAASVYRLVRMRRKPFRYRPTRDGKALDALKRLLPDRLFRKISAMGLD